MGFSRPDFVLYEEPYGYYEEKFLNPDESAAFQDADRAERQRDYEPSPNRERAPEGARSALVGAPLIGRVGPEPVARAGDGWSAPAGPGARSQTDEKAA